MSLVGNLEDLSLGDILQIISLSQKSGVLELSSDRGSGRIVFRSGLVESACLKGAPSDLRDLLVSQGGLEPAALEACVAQARELARPLDEILVREAGLEAERIESLLQAAVESAILEMFTWPSGEFSFDVRTALDGDDPALTLAQPLNAQYLAMEGLRLRDERERDAGNPGAGLPSEDVAGRTGVSALDDPLFGDDPSALDPEPDLGTGAADLLVGAVVDRADPQVEVGLTLAEVEAAMPLARDSASLSGVESGDERGAPAEAIGAHSEQGPRPERGVSPAPEVEAERSPSAGRAQSLPIVLIDPDVAVLDWAKSVLRGAFVRVHVFQQAEQGLSRIRQYLIRGQQPLVLISPETPIDPLCGIHGLGDFVKRLKAQAPRLVVLGLSADAAAGSTALPAALDGTLVRPDRARLTGRSSPETVAAGEALVRDLLDRLVEPTSAAVAPRSASAERSASLKGLRDATIRLQEASSRGEVLPVVLDFASELFERVAILIVREEQVFAVAGRGIGALEIDPLGSDPSISFPVPDAGWVRDVIERRRPLRAAPRVAADQALLEAFGPEVSPEAYLAPIESGSAVIAILFGDQGVGGAPMPDTHALEVVLQHAGLALDRAALERALWEVDEGA